MPRTPVDYSKTLIYKLIKNDDYANVNVYVGSTTDFTRRKTEHKNTCNNENRKGYTDKKYQFIRENGGWSEWNMVEIEKHNCNDGNEARAREEYWRCHFNAQLNMIKSYTTDEERKEYNKKQQKEYREQNKELKKERYEQNKSQILEQQKEYKEKKVVCECGCIVRNDYLKEHRQSQKHLLLTKQIKYEFVDDNGEN